jgi:hypothetical protein
MQLTERSVEIIVVDKNGTVGAFLVDDGSLRLGSNNSLGLSSWFGSG